MGLVFGSYRINGTVICNDEQRSNDAVVLLLLFAIIVGGVDIIVVENEDKTGESYL